MIVYIVEIISLVITLYIIPNKRKYKFKNLRALMCQMRNKIQLKTIMNKGKIRNSFKKKNKKTNRTNNQKKSNLNNNLTMRESNNIVNNLNLRIL